MKWAMTEPDETLFVCQRCGAQYRLVRVETPAAANEAEVECLDCGTPFRAREGSFVLKYFAVKRPRRSKRPR